MQTETKQKVHTLSDEFATGSFSGWLGKFGIKMKKQVSVTDPLLHVSIVTTQVLPLIKASWWRISDTDMWAAPPRPTCQKTSLRASRLTLRNTIAHAHPLRHTWRCVVLRVGHRKAEVECEKEQTTKKTNVNTHVATGRRQNNCSLKETKTVWFLSTGSYFHMGNSKGPVYTLIPRRKLSSIYLYVALKCVSDCVRQPAWDGFGLWSSTWNDATYTYLLEVFLGVRDSKTTWTDNM